MLGEIVRSVMDDAATAQRERRTQRRRPFFQPVMLSFVDSEERFSAFSRDISFDGIGLLHSTPIEARRTFVTLTLSCGQIATLLVDIEWCVSCGEGWYVSGGSFVDGRYESEVASADGGETLASTKQARLAGGQK
jgi:hypothetical protein